MKVLRYLFVLLSSAGLARESKTVFSRQVDSLIHVLGQTRQDTEKVKLLNRICFDLRQVDFKNAQDFGRQSLALAHKADYRKGEARAANNIGLSFYYHSEFDSAVYYYKRALQLALDPADDDNLANTYNCLGILYKDKANISMSVEYLNRALNLRKSLHDSLGMATVYQNLGNTLNKSGNYPGAVQYYLEAISIQEKKNEAGSLARSYNGLGNTYLAQKKYEESIAYFLKAQNLFRKKNEPAAVATVLQNIGNAYFYLGKYDLAKSFYEQVMETWLKTQNRKGMAQCYLNLGCCELRTQHFKEAEDRLNKSLDLYEGIGSKSEQAQAVMNLAVLYNQTSRKDKAKEYLRRAIQLGEEGGNANDIMGNYLEGAELFADMNDYPSAYKLQRNYIRVSDSLFNASTAQTVAQMQKTFDLKSKEHEIELLSRQKEFQTEKIKRQQLLLALLILLVLLFVALILLLRRSNKRSRSANLELREAYRTIDEKNKSITDSIDYARKIQGAILPLEHDLARVFPSGFGIFLPKDIVSGDFYWFDEQREGFFLAIADCTGHGVPGAFMSMLGSDKLTHAVRDQKLDKPSDILAYLNRSIRDTLKQNDSKGLRDGMDIALCRFDFNRSSLEFAGANRPFYLVRNGELLITPPTKASIGGFTRDEQVFENHVISFKPGDTFYLFTDGLGDQFGGPDGKKFMTKRLKDLLLEIAPQTMQQQEILILEKIKEWRGDREQVDDILIVGIRV